MRKLATMVLLLLGSSALAAQTAPAAFGPTRDLWAGAEFSDFNPDYSCSNNIPLACSNDLLGFGVAADYHFAVKWSATGEARWLPWNGASGGTEASYLLGPKYRLWTHDPLTFSASILAGIGYISVPALRGTTFAYAPGAEADYQISPRISLFAGYEYQVWPSFVGSPTTSTSGQIVAHDHGLSPNGLSFGAKYRIF